MPTDNRIDRSKSRKTEYRAIILQSVPTVSSELLHQLDESLREMAHARYLQIAESLKPNGGKTLTMPPGFVPGSVDNERTLMKALGWYWEPLLHDLAFFEEMRDSVALIAGTFNTFANLIVSGLDITHPDPKIQKQYQDMLLYHPQADLHETVRSIAFEMMSLGNCYRLPVVVPSLKDGPTLFFRPVRAVAMRKLRDKQLLTKGYVQLLHRPSEFINGGVPAIPTVYLDDEVMCGIANSDNWYAYGKPIMASLPFIIKLKLTMEKDVAEMLHQHVPRIDIIYTPEQQMNIDQVNAAVADLQAKMSKLKPTDNLVHTPDVAMDYKGPMGKAMDTIGVQNHVENQFWMGLMMDPMMMGQAQNINPMATTNRWKTMQTVVEYYRTRIKVMITPALKLFAELRHLDDQAELTFKDHDSETAEQNARTTEYNVQNATSARDAGFVGQDQAAQHATSKHFTGGKVKKAAKDGPLAPPLDPNKANTPGKVGNKSKGDKTTKSPTPDKRPKGRGHSSSEQPEGSMTFDEAPQIEGAHEQDARDEDTEGDNGS